MGQHWSSTRWRKQAPWGGGPGLHAISKEIIPLRVHLSVLHGFSLDSHCAPSGRKTPSSSMHPLRRDRKELYKILRMVNCVRPTIDFYKTQNLQIRAVTNLQVHVHSKLLKFHEILTYSSTVDSTAPQRTGGHSLREAAVSGHTLSLTRLRQTVCTS